MTAPRTAALGAPPKPPAGPSRLALDEPPQPHQHKNNLTDGKSTQFNVRLDAAKHREIKIQAINEGLTLTDYLLQLHDTHMQKLRKRA